jgi:hypothetical protein
MGVVMIRCPATKRAISTGIVTDRQTFNATPGFYSESFCPLCRGDHRWFATEAWVEETGYSTSEAV